MANTDFLRFNAYSIRDLINRKLSEDSNFTDQIYPGSNLAVLIDIFSYMTQLLLYSLNNAASESMFSDTELYENMNRLCNFIGYNPKGMSPASVTCKLTCKIQVNDINTKPLLERIIFPYSCINTGITDTLGKPIFYSISNNENLNSSWNIEKKEINDENSATYTLTKNITMYNGKWKLYNKIFVSDGNSWQTFELTNVKSDTANNNYVAHDFFDVYVVDNDDYSKVYKFKQTSFQLFKNPFKINEETNVIGPDGYYDTTSFLYSGNIENANSRIFNLRLNENKNYVISFGDGSSGAVPPKNSSIYIVYLETNGPYGMIDIGKINTSSFEINTTGLNGNILENTWFNGPINPESIFGIDPNDDNITNITSSTYPVLEESVDAIRENAPNWFKIGNRLVTKSDYEYFIKSYPTFASQFSDILCMNNWDYICSFFKWLYNLGIKSENNSRKYLNQNKLIKSDYTIADAADANNVYLWYIPSNVMIAENRKASEKQSAFQLITNVVEPIKDLTHEVVILPGIPVRFEVCAAPNEVAKNWVTSGGVENFLSNNRNTYIEVTLNDNYLYSPSNIYSMIIEKIVTYFSNFNKFGGSINFGEINTMISEIEGINKIRTIFKPNDGSNPTIYDGISMASWTTDNNNLIDEGIDFEVGMSGRSLEKFQYAYIDNKSIAALINQIKVIKTTASTLNQTQY